MQISVAFRHMDSSDALNDYATSKLEHVTDKYINGQDTDARVVFSVEKFWHIANFTVMVNGLTVKAIERTENMYSSVDLALDRLERQLRRYKDRIRSHKPSNRKREFTMGILAPDDEEEIDPDEELDEITPEIFAPSKPVTVVKHESYEAPYLSPEEAVMQLNLRDAPFFVFTHAETERINIIHRRDDGGYGLIDPDH
jgi:putative sigma-54 modulation protein